MDGVAVVASAMMKQQAAIASLSTQSPYFYLPKKRAL
jgi:hypothetical protein